MKVKGTKIKLKFLSVEEADYLITKVRGIENKVGKTTKFGDPVDLGLLEKLNYMNKKLRKNT